VRGPATSASRPPLVFFVDELDRCRPSYAIEFLEMAKHLFSVQGTVFVLAINAAQLANAIRALYGEKFDAERYLRRFVDVQLDLPVPEIRKYAPVILGGAVGERSFASKHVSRNLPWKKPEPPAKVLGSHF